MRVSEILPMMSCFKFIFHLLKAFSLRFYKNRCVGEFFSEAELPCSIMLMQLNFTLARHCNKAKLARPSQSVIFRGELIAVQASLSSRHQLEG